MPYMRQLATKEMACPDTVMSIGSLIALKQLLLFILVFQLLVLLIIGITLTTHLEDLPVTRQRVVVFYIPDCILMHKLQGWNIV